jgi:hypothetical protein
MTCERHLAAKAPVDRRSRSAQMRTRVIRSKENPATGPLHKRTVPPVRELCLTRLHCSSAFQRGRQGFHCDTERFSPTQHRSEYRLRAVMRNAHTA